MILFSVRKVKVNINDGSLFEVNVGLNSSVKRIDEEFKKQCFDAFDEVFSLAHQGILSPEQSLDRKLHLCYIHLDCIETSIEILRDNSLMIDRSNKMKR